jgi:hypothetical protein
LSLNGHYQNAYVTHDLDRAVDLVGPSFGVGDFTMFDIEMTARTPEGEKLSQVRVGLGWAGRLQIELIQPVSGFIEPYLYALPADKSDAVPRLHHVAVRRESLDEMRREAATLGLPIAFESGGAGLDCIFLDARARLGHFFEMVCASPEGWEMVGWPSGQA